MIRRPLFASPAARAIDQIFARPSFPALPVPGARALSTDEFLETLRRRVLIPFVDATGADVRLSVGSELPPAVGAREARSMWMAAREALVSIPPGARVLVHARRHRDRLELEIAVAS